MAFNEPAAVARAMFQSDKGTKVVPQVAWNDQDGSPEIVAFGHEPKPVEAPGPPPMQERPAVLVAVTTIAVLNVLMSVVALFSPGVALTVLRCISLPSNTGWFALSNDYSYGLVWRSTPDGRNELVCQWHASGEDPFCNTGIEVTVILVILIVLALVGYSLSADPA